MPPLLNALLSGDRRQNIGAGRPVPRGRLSPRFSLRTSDLAPLTLRQSAPKSTGVIIVTLCYGFTMPHQNLLCFETSPYLQQHADNPVHWAPWGPAALDEARQKNKPILLSIGYAACHWCHVMAHESFEDADTAAIMNAHFVCIKVDREERPDIDDLYMTALSLMGEQGGWPLTMFLDPLGQPFWGGTYFPKAATHGRPAFSQLLSEVARAYQEGHAQIETNSQAIMAALRSRSAPKMRAGENSQNEDDHPEGGALSAPPATHPAQLASTAMRSLANHIDPEHGGLGGAPKFPQPTLFHFLLEQAQFEADTATEKAVLHTLRQICRGGIYDHLGGGFARYTVDAAWLIPHFEKMLYDNALLIDLLCLAWKASPEAVFVRRIEDTIDWLCEDMALASGGFAASRDADSDGHEGAFYVWSMQELRAVLGGNTQPDDGAPQESVDAVAFAKAYGCSPEGNFEGQNILNRLGQNNDDDEAQFAPARARLKEVRQHRTPPARDDKLLADWNGMLISALVHASDVFNRTDWLKRAEDSFDALCAALNTPDGLRHSACFGKTMTIGLGEDYVHMITAALKLYAATGRSDYLTQAEIWLRQLDGDHLSYDAYTSSPHTAHDVLVHHRPIDDGATPSLNGAALHMLILFHSLTGRTELATKASALVAQFNDNLTRHYPRMPHFLQALNWLDYFTVVVIVAPDLGDRAHHALRQAAAGQLTRGVVMSVAADTVPADSTLAPAFGKTSVDNKPTAYVCPPGYCLEPITDPETLKKTLQKPVF